MKTIQVITDVLLYTTVWGPPHQPGTTIELPETEAERLLAIGHVRRVGEAPIEVNGARVPAGAKTSLPPDWGKRPVPASLPFQRAFPSNPEG